MNRTAYEKDLLRRVVSSVLTHGGSEILSSIILTGSFGRNEPTYTVNDDGTFILKSDVEIALVTSGRQNMKKAAQLILDVSQEFAEDLNLMVLSEKRIRNCQNFNYSFLTPKYKTVFTYDLFNGSMTIWGHDFLKENRVAMADVDLYEAKRLVANRIGELVYVCNHTSVRENPDSVIQWKGKLMLALGSAWLLLNQAYVSSYHGQFERLKEHKEKINKELGMHFFEEYERVFHFLRDNEQTYAVSDEVQRAFVKKMDSILSASELTCPKVNNLSRLVKYCIKYLKTGMKFGLLNFEDRILQTLISQYSQADPAVFLTADVWHSVLY